VSEIIEKKRRADEREEDVKDTGYDELHARRAARFSLLRSRFFSLRHTFADFLPEMSKPWKNIETNPVFENKIRKILTIL